MLSKEKEEKKSDVISGVVVTHNNEATVERCIKSMWENQIHNIVVVDNASTDQTVQRVKGCGIRPQLQTTNTGFAMAANKGAKSIQTEYILFLNPDAALTRGAWKKARHYLNTHPGVEIVGLGLHDAVGRHEQNSWGKKVTLGSLAMRQIMRSKTPQKPRYVGWVSGAAMIVSTKTFHRLGGFDEQFFMYWEDVDLCERARQQGSKVAVLPQAQAMHRRGQSLRDQVKKTTLYDASADKYFHKHYPAHIWYLQRLLRQLYRSISPQVQ